MYYNSQIQMLKNKKNNKDNRHSKSRNKRILTVYAVHPFINETLPKATSLPLKKIPRHSITNHNPKPKQASKRDKPKHHTSTLKAKPIQIYERVPMNFVQSNSNSEIQFSNYDEVSNEPRLMRKSLFINCDQEALIQQIWRGDKRKKGVEQEAATKIQKVFRGYLTRKLLMQYVDEYEEKLLAERQILQRKPSFKSVKDNDGSYHSSFKNSYFPSNKKELVKAQSCNSEQKYNPIDLQSEIMRVERESCQSIYKSELSNPREQERRGSQAQPSSITLNESSIEARVQEISLSFGQEGQHSPHFVQPTNRKQIGGQMFSPTKPLNHVISHISDDKTRDAISQNISNCPSYSKANQVEPSEPSHLSSLMKQEMVGEGEGVHIQKLRSTQKAKWEQVIQFVNHQIKQGLNQQKTRELMSTILQFSVKNKEELSNNFKPHDLAQVTPTTMTHREQELQQPFLQAQPLPFKKKKWREEEHQNNLQKINKNQDMPLLRTHKQLDSLFDRTSNLKQYFLKTINFEDHQIDKMMQLREAVLRKKESHSLVELQHLLENNLLTQEQFLQRLCKLTQQFSRQKEEIEQTKNEIYQGYKAQFQLLRFTYLDAKYLGYQLPFCRSMEIFPNNSNWRFDELMIDELNQLAQRKTRGGAQQERQPNTLTDSEINNILQNRKEDEQRQNFDESFSPENSVSFSYEQVTISRKCEPFSIDISQSEQHQFVFSPKARRNSLPYTKGLSIPISDLNSRNVTPCKNQQEQSEHQNEEEQRQSPAHSFRKQTYEISVDSEQQEEVLYKEGEENLNLKVVDICLTKLIWETIEDIYFSNSIRSSLGVGHNKLALQPITKEEKLLFLDIVICKMPQFDSLQERLNQKMYPNAKELLMSMREASDFSSDEPEYFQIGQYQYILNQQICYEVIESYLTLYRSNRKTYIEIHKRKQTEIEVQQQFGLFASNRLKKMLNGSTRAEVQKAEENQELREEIVKIQLHLMLDSWNQELIRYRQNKNGYSGIGLNELSLSLIDRVCRPMTGQTQLLEMLHQTRLVLADIIRDDSLNEKLIKEYQQVVCDNDSQWIMYSQQALEYGFEMARTIQIELIFEMLQDLHLINQIGRSEGSLVQFDEDLLELNEEEVQQLQKKMQEIQGAASDSDDSFYD